MVMSAGRSFEAVLLRPVVSEKSYAAMGGNKYVFRCPTDANKVEIRNAVEQAFASQKVNVVDVNTVTVRGRTRSRSRRNGRSRVIGRSPGWKKAIVTLAPGQKIEGLFGSV
jgi:large subunit ribosomal protein L23